MRPHCANRRTASTCNEQAEGGDADAVFVLKDGATLSNVYIGPNNGEGVHCLGTCTLNNVWWTDVCEDAATFKQSSGTSYVNGGGARKADDKVLQHNGGGTVAVKNFFAQDVGKVYRSCGNCETQVARKSTFDNIRVNGGDVVAGVNGNLGGESFVRMQEAENMLMVCQTQPRSRTPACSIAPLAGSTRALVKAVSPARLLRHPMARPARLAL